jgi:hypothetical protein
MSPYPQGTPCYALVWEGAIGAFYAIDPNVNFKWIADVMKEPGNRYAAIYGLSDPTFPKDSPFSRFADATHRLTCSHQSSSKLDTNNHRQRESNITPPPNPGNTRDCALSMGVCFRRVRFTRRLGSWRG